VARSGAQRRCVTSRETTSPGGPARPGDGTEAGWQHGPTGRMRETEAGWRRGPRGRIGRLAAGLNGPKVKEKFFFE
jgi:hypothetical protein